MRVEILGIERRRRWHDDEKLEIVLSVGIGGATVTDVARRRDVTRQQIYRRRHELKKKGLLPPDEGTVFVPIDFRPPEIVRPEPVPAAPIHVELEFTNGRCLKFDSAMKGTALTRLIRAVEAA
jgi:transposase